MRRRRQRLRGGWARPTCCALWRASLFARPAGIGGGARRRGPTLARSGCFGRMRKGATRLRALAVAGRVLALALARHRRCSRVRAQSGRFLHVNGRQAGIAMKACIVAGEVATNVAEKKGPRRAHCQRGELQWTREHRQAPCRLAGTGVPRTAGQARRPSVGALLFADGRGWHAHATQRGQVAGERAAEAQRGNCSPCVLGGLRERRRRKRGGPRRGCAGNRMGGGGC